MTPFDIQRCVQIAERTILLPEALALQIAQRVSFVLDFRGGGLSSDLREVRTWEKEWTAAIAPLIAVTLADQRAMIAQSLSHINPTVEERSLRDAIVTVEDSAPELDDALNKLMLFYPVGPKTQYNEINAALLAVSVACLESPVAPQASVTDAPTEQAAADTEYSKECVRPTVKEGE